MLRSIKLNQNLYVFFCRATFQLLNIEVPFAKTFVCFVVSDMSKANKYRYKNKSNLL